MTDDYMSWAAGSDIGDHLPYLHQRAKTAKVMLELGVRNGCSTAALLAGAEDGDGHLWSIDILEPGPPANGWYEDPRWSLLIADDTSDRAKEWAPAELDLLFIDTSHEYGHTVSELSCYGSRVRPGGVILLHDTELEAAPLSAEEGDRSYPVRRAVEDWCRRVFLTPVFREGCYGLGVIEVP